jgi:hypothetical protein
MAACREREPAGGHLIEREAMPSASRPTPQLSYQPSDHFAEALAILGLAGEAAYALLVYPTLPATIPIHFGFDGKANHYGGREWIFFPFAAALALYLLLNVVGRYPQAFNYPWRVTEANAPRLYPVARRMLVWLKTEVILVFAYITWAIVRYATVAPGPFDWWFIAAVLLVVFGTVGLFIFQMRPATWGRQYP